MIRIIITFLLSFFLFVTSIFAQDITGDWYGQIDVQGSKLRISFHVNEKDKTYATTMDSPDQMAFGIPTDETIVLNNNITISLKSMMIVFNGRLNKDIIKGTFSQGGMDFPLILSHKKITKEKKKPKFQEPTKPYPYKSEEITFVNKKANNITLSGTLTLPKNIKKPVVAILISGSGPQNRDEEILDHKPFLVLADHLTNNGIAVLRYDDRGVAKSEGTQNNATSADFATDVEAAITYLQTRKDIDTSKIGLIGHSEGGLIAPMVAANNDNVAFIVLLAGPGVNGAEVLKTQTKKAFELAGLTKKHIDFNNKVSEEIYNMVKIENDNNKLQINIIDYLNEVKKVAPDSYAKELTDTAIKIQAKTISSPWMTYFIKTNPKEFLNQVNCPVLAINGSKDIQVIADLNLSGINSALKHNDDVTVKKLEGLNHLFQTCETGAVNEYAKIKETFSPKALQIISNWINKRF